VKEWYRKDLRYNYLKDFLQTIEEALDL